MTQIAKRDETGIMESVVVHGDLSRLDSTERTAYYLRVCESAGLNPHTKPFEYLRLNGREILYATRTCTDQLRKIHGVSIRVTSREHVGDVYVVAVSATDSTGRTDESTGAVTVGSITGDTLANALMKAETKAKRRVTLSICGLGWLDESELETVPNSRMVDAVAKESALVEEQARHRVESDRLADDFIGMIDACESAANIERFCYFNGYEMRLMHATAKARVWRNLVKRAESFEVPHQEMKAWIRDSPEPAEEEEET